MIVKEVIAKEKKGNKGNGVNGTQSFNNYHFVYNSNSSKNKEILRLNNPQNRHKVFFELSRNKKIISNKNTCYSNKNFCLISSKPAVNFFQ